MRRPAPSLANRYPRVTTLPGRSLRLALLAVAMLFVFPVMPDAFVLQSGVSSRDDQTHPVKWAHLPVDFVLDGGTLAGQEGFPLIADALDTWDNVPTARRLGGDLIIYVDSNDDPIDFTADNLGIDYGIIGDGINEIVFDETGQILETLGLDPDTTAGVSITIEDTAQQEITDAMLVLNGTFDSSPQLDTKASAIHELGHIWGLSHTFIGAVNTVNGEPGSWPIDPEWIPTMYPFENPVDDRYARTLEWDDMAGVSWLYPEESYAPPDQIPFGSDTGLIRGQVFYDDQLALNGVHVRAVNMDNPNIQVSNLSGFLADGTGTFDIPGVPAGSYRLVLEGIDGRDGITAADIEDDGIGACAFDGFAEITTFPLDVNEGQGVDIGQQSIPELPLEDNDAVEFSLPDSFGFTFMDLPCRRLFLYSNGYVSVNRYEDPDPAMTVSGADLHDFLSRPMARLCPLRTDLDPAGNTAGQVGITATDTDISVTFTHVAIVGSSARATFGLDLFPGGAFRYSYDQTGDPVALVGYTSGVFDSGGQETSADLTAYAGGSVPTAHNRVMFQLVNGADLDGSSLDFPEPATDPLPVRNRLVYPWLAHNEYFTMGLAVVSNSDTTCRIRLSAYDINGHLLPVKSGAANPVVRTLEPYEQYVSQVNQIFDFAGDSADGWILVETDNPDPLGIQGFFLAQSYYDGILDSLDGAVALADTDTTLVFPRYTGDPGEYTEVTVVNPNAVSSDVTLTVYWADGSDSTLQDTIPPNGAAIFPLEGEGSAYVIVDAGEPVTGFAMNFNQVGSLAGQSGRFLWESRAETVSPHFLFEDGVYGSRLDLVNPNDNSTQVTVRLHDADGAAVGQPVTLTIDGWYNARVDLGPATFGFSGDGYLDGWLEVSADRPILGSMTFGDADFAVSQSTLPLLGVPLHYTLNAHLAQGNSGGVEYLTGLAALSLDGGNAFILGDYDAQGYELDQVTETIGADQRRIGVLSQWIPDGPWPQLGGYLAGSATEGIYLYEIFSTWDAAFYAAVPAQKYLPLQEEQSDTDNGWPESPEALTGFPIQVRGWFSPDDFGWFLVDLGDGYTDEVEDLYRFDVQRAGSYIITLTPDNRYCDMDAYLFDSTWTIIDSSTQGVPGAEYIEVYLDPGTYYIGASLFDLGWFETAGYHLAVEPDAINTP